MALDTATKDVWLLPQEEKKLQKRYRWMPPPSTQLEYDEDYVSADHLRDLASRMTRLHAADMPWYTFLADAVPKALESHAKSTWKGEISDPNSRHYFILSRLSNYFSVALRKARAPKLFCMVGIMEAQRRNDITQDFKYIRAVVREQILMTGDERERDLYREALIESVVPKSEWATIRQAGFDELAAISPECLPGFLFFDQRVRKPAEADLDEESGEGFHLGGMFTNPLAYDCFRALMVNRPSRTGLTGLTDLRGPLDVTNSLPSSLRPITCGLVAYIYLLISLSLEAYQKEALQELFEQPEKSLSLTRYRAWGALLRGNPGKELSELLTLKWDFQCQEADYVAALSSDDMWERVLDTRRQKLKVRNEDQMYPHMKDL